MKNCLAAIAIALLLSPLVACKKPVDDKAAVTDAVQSHLKSLTTINMAAMDSSINQISINGDQAEAAVDFRLKQGGATMQVIYSLERHAGNWVITSNRPGGGQFSHPPMDQTHANLPPNQAQPPMPDVHEILKNLPASTAQSNPHTQPAAGRHP